MADFKKNLFVSSQSSRLSRDEFVLDRVAWKDIGRIRNFCDYDRILINLTALAEQAASKIFEKADIDRVFDPASWLHVLLSGGGIFVVGDPNVTIQVVNTTEEISVKALAVKLQADAKQPGPHKRAIGADLKPESAATFQQVDPLEKLLSIEKDARPLDYRRIDRT